MNFLLDFKSVKTLKEITNDCLNLGNVAHLNNASSIFSYLFPFTLKPFDTSYFFKNFQFSKAEERIRY